MEIDLNASNVPFHVDPGVILTSRDLETWKTVPWAYCSKDERPDTHKRKYYSLGALRFCEGWLNDDLNEYGAFHKEWYWAEAFRSWFNLRKQLGHLTTTKNCEGCQGSFWKLASDELCDAMPGYWAVEGRWYLVGGEKSVERAPPPSLCQIDQLRYNRRLTIQLKVWGKSDNQTPLSEELASTLLVTLNPWK